MRVLSCSGDPFPGFWNRVCGSMLIFSNGKTTWMFFFFFFFFKQKVWILCIFNFFKCFVIMFYLLFCSGFLSWIFWRFWYLFFYINFFSFFFYNLIFLWYYEKRLHFLLDTNGQWAKKYNRPFAAQKAKKAMAEALLRIKKLVLLAGINF